MDTIWKVRPHSKPAFARQVGSNDTADLAVGNVAVLHASDDKSDVEIKVRIRAFESGRVRGDIASVNRLGAAGDKRFAADLSVLFEEKHVFRIERDAQPGVAAEVA
jgi:hypothetical protein